MAKSMQDTFLNTIRKGKIPCTIITVNGFQIKNALITAFDSFSLLIEAEEKQQLLFKHAVSSIQPAEKVDVTEEQTN